MLPYSLAIAQGSVKIDRCLSHVLIGDLGAKVTQLQGTETTGNGEAVSSGGHPGVEQFMMEPTFKRSILCF
jgi:hypothetical protein